MWSRPAITCGPTLAEEAFFDTPALADLMRGGGVVSVEAMRRVVQANLSHGVDWIKVLATERAGTPDTDPRKQVYTEEELRAIVQEAATKNVPVQAHAHGAEGALAAVRAGVRSIEHGTYLTDETLQLMAKQGTFFDPTMEALKDVGGRRRRLRQSRPAAARTAHAAAPQRRDRASAQAGRQDRRRFGHRLWSGERRPRVEGDRQSRRCRPARRWRRCARRRSTGAEMLRLDKQIGQVAPGFEADLVVVERNPLEEVATLQDPLLVISNGRVGLDRLTFGRADELVIATAMISAFGYRIGGRSAAQGDTHEAPTRDRSRLYLYARVAGCCPCAA